MLRKALLMRLPGTITSSLSTLFKYKTPLNCGVFFGGRKGVIAFPF